MHDVNQTSTTQVRADLTIESDQGNIRVTNNTNGDLLVDFPNNEAFFNILKVKWPIRLKWNTLFQLNKELYQSQQVLIVQLNNIPWVVLGSKSRPILNYLKVASSIITRKPLIKNSLIVITLSFTATLFYTLFRKRN